MQAYWIWLANRKGMGCKQKLELVSRFPHVRALWQAQEYDMPLSPTARASLDDKDLSSAQAVLDRCGRMGIQLICAGEEAYPRRLLNIADPPLVLYCKGRLPDFDREAAVAVVGTRKASAYGLMSAERISGQIARHGGLVVSGLAAGIDAQAGWGAVRAGCPTVAVLGGGVDVIYPAANRDLYEAILQKGCILSEYPPGTKPNKWTFPQRNRIVSGLSVATLVVEAPEKSGTMITARLAHDQGRDLFVIPGHIDSDLCAGSNLLLRDGARIATCGWDILREYAALFSDKLRKEDMPAAQPETPPTLSFSDATAEEQALLELLMAGERTVDELIDASGMDTSKALAILTMLEIKGMVTTLPGRRVKLS